MSGGLVITGLLVFSGTIMGIQYLFEKAKDKYIKYKFATQIAKEDSDPINDIDIKRNDDNISDSVL